MKKKSAIAVVGTFDSKAEEHFFLKKSIEQRGVQTLTINVGTRGPSPSPVSIDFFDLMQKREKFNFDSRDMAIAAMISVAQKKIYQLYLEGKIGGIIFHCGKARALLPYR